MIRVRLNGSRADFLSYPALIPRTEIQRAFDEFESRCDVKIAPNRVQSRTLAILQDTLLLKPLSGELSVARLSFLP